MERQDCPIKGENPVVLVLRKIAVFLTYVVLHPTLVPLYRLRIRNEHHLQGPAITVMNHCLYMEWFFIRQAVWPRFVRFTAEEANITRKDIGWINVFMGVLGIPENNPMAVAGQVSWALKNGELVHFFPEGTLKHRSTEPGPFFIGAAWFACRHDVPLIPVAEVLSFRNHPLLPKWWPPRVTLVVGEPLRLSDFHTKGGKLRTAAEDMTKAAETFIASAIRDSEG